MDKNAHSAAVARFDIAALLDVLMIPQPSSVVLVAVQPVACTIRQVSGNPTPGG
jgi:hypothetical protein